jgi:hypothetical protein
VAEHGQELVLAAVRVFQRFFGASALGGLGVFRDDDGRGVRERRDHVHVIGLRRARLGEIQRQRA